MHNNHDQVSPVYWFPWMSCVCNECRFFSGVSLPPNFPGDPHLKIPSKLRETFKSVQSYFEQRLRSEQDIVSKIAFLLLTVVFVVQFILVLWWWRWRRFLYYILFFNYFYTDIVKIYSVLEFLVSLLLRQLHWLRGPERIQWKITVLV